MKKHTILVGLVVVAAASAIVVAFLYRRAPHDSMVTGTVTRINNGCWMDADCSVTIDDNVDILTGCGLGANGETCPTFDQSKLKVGERVRAIYKITSHGNDLGCPNCSIVKLN